MTKNIKKHNNRSRKHETHKKSFNYYLHIYSSNCDNILLIAVNNETKKLCYSNCPPYY